MILFNHKIYKSLLLFTLVSSCTSYHNLRIDGANHLGGGFIETELATGLYKLTVKTNFAPWTNFSGAWDTWNKRAKELCDKQDFENVEVKESSYNTAAGRFYIVSQVRGFVLCSYSDSDKVEIERLVSIHHH